MKSKTIILLTAASLAAVSSSPAAVTLYAEYLLGETGSLGTDNRPLDNSGNSRNFTGETGGVDASVLTAGVFAPGSSAYLSTANVANNGWYTVSFDSLPTDNFAFGIYVRSFENTSNTQGYAFLLGGATGSFGVGLEATGWNAGAFNTATIGTNGTFTANAWTHLAVIRSGGTATFYINGLAQAGTYTGATEHTGGGHLSADPGGARWFDGDMDNARVVTFTVGESATNVLNALQVPEPTSALLVGLGGLGLLLRRRR